MRLFFRSAVLFAALFWFSWFYFPKWLGLQFPQQPGPHFDSQVRKNYLEAIDAARPDIVFLGDSTLGYGVDTDLLSRSLQKKIYKLRINGSASAMWYLVLKNNLAEAEFKPKYLIIIMRDTILTAPGYRVQGAYQVQLDEFASRHENLLTQRAYLDLMNPLEYELEKYVPLYGARVEIRRAVDGAIRYFLPALAGCDRNCTDTAMFETFGASDLEPGQLRNAVAVAENYLYTPDQLNFPAQMEKSFLPEIIRITQENHIRLIIVRLKTYSSGMTDIESLALKSYARDLGAYLAKNNVPFLDFGTDPRLP